MSVLTARLKRLETTHEIMRFATLLIEARNEVAEKVNLSRLVMPGFAEKVASSIQKGNRPLLDEEVLECIDYGVFSELLAEVFVKLLEKGSIDGEVERILENLKANPAYGRQLLESALGIVESVTPTVETEVLTHIVLTPLQPLLKTINQKNSRTQTPTYVRSCLTCGRNYILGIYRGGFRHMLCSACGHVARVDFFYCPTCGNTDPNSLRFKKPVEEPYFQIELCDRCGAYYKMVNEDILGTVADDPLLIDFATIDLDNIANSLRSKPP
ncbi:MAG: formate dehydrogenase accessory protein FdhE [Candidatus Caldarchaeum sp.]|nr:formate dehydrogenase accessory protein FdhE [Candidatus Caldarchaeum sp.]MDW8434808.1 formate dehydrogenase accessory protein FdhE [Candidatus Caldarchaeum sp.]